MSATAIHPVIDYLLPWLLGETTEALPTAQAIADSVGLSRERVRQVVAHKGWDWQVLRRQYPRPSPSMGECRSCGKRRRTYGRVGGKCLECRRRDEFVTLTCARCGNDFQRLAREHKRRGKMGMARVFCSLECFVGPDAEPAMMRGKLADYVCANCETVFQRGAWYRQVKQHKGKRFFCKRACVYEFRRKQAVRVVI